MTARALTILNQMGDTTIVWTEDRDDEMERIIAAKMAQGVAFFIIEPRFFGLLPSKKTRLEDAASARHYRALTIPDEDFAKFVDSGSGEAVKTPSAPAKGARRSKNAGEVARAQSVGVKPMKGG
jgi:hypothetical protein